MILKVVEAPRPDVDDIVERLEKLLVLARAGELETPYHLFGGGQRWDTGRERQDPQPAGMIGSWKDMKPIRCVAQDIGGAA